MSKKEFLDKLRRRLAILKDDEIEDIIIEYGGYIDEKVKNKKISESDAILEFGDFDELVSEILSAYKIDDEKNKTKNYIMGFFDDIGRALESFFKDLGNKEVSDIVKIILEVLFIILIIGICRIPLEILISIGSAIFTVLPWPVDNILRIIWRVVFEISYAILAIVFFYRMFKNRHLSKYFNLNSENKNKEDTKSETKKENPKKDTKKTKETKADKQKDEIVSEAKTDDVKVVKKEVNYSKDNNDNGNIIFKLFIGFLKVIVAFCLIPAIFSLVGLFIVLGLGIGLVISGVHYFGVLLTIGALLGFGIMIVKLMFNFLFSKRVSGVGIFASLITNIVLLAAGISIATFEIADTEFINEAPSNYEIKTLTEEYSAKDIDYISHINYHYSEPEYIYDETLKDKIRVELEYYDELTDPRITVYNGALSLNYYNNGYTAREFFKAIKEDLRNREIHNYAKIYNVNIKIYGTKENIERILKDTRTRDYDLIKMK